MILAMAEGAQLERPGKISFRCKVKNILNSLTDQNFKKYGRMRTSILQQQSSFEEERRLLRLFSGIPKNLLVHVMEVPNGFRVFRLKDEAFESFMFSSQKEAKKFLKTLQEPLELGSISPKLGKELIRIKKNLGQIIGDEKITQRIKDTYSVKRKIFRLIDDTDGSYPMSRLKDLIGFRVIVKSKNDKSKIVEKLKKELGEEFVSLKNINKVEQTGYRATHIIGRTPGGQLYEVQVVTEMMKKWHAWDHKYVYKSIYPPGEYQDKLIQYSRSVAHHVRRLEDGKKSKMPHHEKFGILEKDAFKEEIEL